MRLSLVGTVHAESGLANVVELQALLQRLHPDVIFAEISSADVDQYLDASRGSLESIAVWRYRESRQVVVIPVDLARPEDEFFSNAQHLFDTVERTSPDYRRMMDRNSLDTCVGGFPYLNSERCMQSWADIYRELKATVEWLREPRLRQIYDLWNHTNELRDAEMMRRIENYCVSSVFAHGLFLVGAAHRKSIVEKARARGVNATPRFEWNVSGLLYGSA